MGILDFFKKNKPQVTEPTKISQNELQDWLLKKQTKIDEQEQEFFLIVKEKISQLISELTEQISILHEVNLDAKKVEERVKQIINENLNNYIDYLEKAIQRLREINSGKDFIDKINFIFSEFKEKSHISYEKVTFLIGKEMKNTKESISKFFKDLERTIKANKDLVEESKIIRSTKEKFGKSQELKKTSLELTEKIKQSQGKINKLNQELKTKQKEIEDLQKSEKFLKEIEKQQTLEEKKQELENNIDQLRNIIDFKALANFYHNFEKQMKMVKEYREEFKQTFQRTNPQEILDLLKGANIQNNSVLEKIHEIDTKKKEVKEIVLEETGLKDLQRTQDRLKFEINTKSTEKSLREKRLEKIQDNLNEIIGSIKINLKKIDVEFE